jgi:hypothetical protein
MTVSPRRRSDHDVTDRVHIADPRAVCTAVCGLLAARYPGMSLAPLHDAFDTFTKLYAGTLPGYYGCDTWYHDAQHSLDCTLAMARLLDGHDGAAAPAARLGERRALLGVIIALFHDAGYIRKAGDKAENGAEFTLNHVRRSGEFLADYLPGIGFEDAVDLTRQLVHYTGYEVALDKIEVTAPKDRLLGFMLGTADILAQTADRCYLEKCRDFLYHEFEICGLAGAGNASGPTPIYSSPEDLLLKSPEFNRKLREERLDGYFERCYRHLEHHFQGPNLYLEAIDEHMQQLERLIRADQVLDLRRQPRAVNAAQLRETLGLPQLSAARIRRRDTPSVPRSKATRVAAARHYVPT